MSERIEKLTAQDGESKDLVTENIEKLKRLFPEIVTEGKIDFEVLKDLLGEFTEKSDERYSFTWNGKSKARKLVLTPSRGTLRPAPEESVNWDTTDHLFIEGDNLEVLKLLQRSYHKKVKMIYIDPPYNTGKNFVYNDDYKDNLKNYLRGTGQLDDDGKKLSSNLETSGRYHTDWLNMMYPRLKLARELLTDDGVIFISIDDHEVHNLRKVCDEIFGEENLLAELIWNLSSGTQAGHFTRSNEMIITYAKHKDRLPYFKDRSWGTIKHGALKKISKVNPSSEVKFPAGSITFEGENAEFEGVLGESEKQYIKKGKLKFKDGVLVEDVVIEAGWAMKNQLLSWLDGKETYDTKGQRVIRFYFNSNGILFYEKERGTVHPKTVIHAKDVGNTRTGGSELKNLLGENYMDFPKPSSLISYLISIVSSENDLILDFFAGSCPLAQSVLELNFEEGLNRKFMVVQLPEKVNENSSAYEKGYKTISEIGQARIKKVINNILQKYPNNKKDLGFKLFKLNSSNIKPWDPSFDHVQLSLEDSIENIKPDRSELDVLYEILLKYGLDLTLPIEERIIGNTTVYIVGAGALILCLSDQIDLEVVEEGIAKIKEELQPELIRVVFRDSGFKDDVVKTNAVQILKQYGIEDVKCI